MTSDHPASIRRLCRPLSVLPTGAPPSLQRLEGIQGVLFDVYGTMFISGSGDVGVAQESGQASAFTDALTACGYDGPCDAAAGVSCLLETIRKHQQQARDAGVEYPEIDILRVWPDAVADLVHRGAMEPPSQPLDWEQLAIAYEFRVNPCWPMPDLCETLESLRAAGLALGIISNAQFYTLEMFRGLLGSDPNGFGFDPKLQFYSYRFGQAKPGTFLYQQAAAALVKQGLAVENILYVGNDMLNDVVAAAAVGFRTALFAGDQRSLRWRSGDQRVRGTRPQLVLPDLRSLPAWILPPPIHAAKGP
jgi:putative hydrolase of the HAD superfamily